MISTGVQISGNTSPCCCMNARSLPVTCGFARCRQFQVSRTGPTGEWKRNLSLADSPPKGNGDHLPQCPSWIPQKVIRQRAYTLLAFAPPSTAASRHLPSLLAFDLRHSPFDLCPEPFCPPMMRFTQGNLLDARVEALVNTVNTVGVMGKGIALMSRSGFPRTSRLTLRPARLARCRWAACSSGRDPN